MWTFILIIIFIYICIYAFNLATCGLCKSKLHLINKTILVTGGNSGIGYQTALSLASRGATVIIADKDNCDETKQKIINLTGNNKIITKYLNLESFKSIREFAKDINETISRLDILINNAGIPPVYPPQYTEDGFDFVMQINYLGPFLLTHLLINLLKKSKPSRIIFNSSILAFLAFNVKLERLIKLDYSILQYSYSKYFLSIASQQFARKLKKFNITSNVVHPGVVNTPIYDKLLKNKLYTLYLIVKFCLHLFAKTPEEGAQTTLHCATSPELENITGKFFCDCKQFIQPFSTSNYKFIDEIWNKSQELTKLLENDKL